MGTRLFVDFVKIEQNHPNFTKFRVPGGGPLSPLTGLGRYTPQPPPGLTDMTPVSEWSIGVATPPRRDPPPPPNLAPPRAEGAEAHFGDLPRTPPPAPPSPPPHPHFCASCAPKIIFGKIPILKMPFHLLSVLGLVMYFVIVVLRWLHSEAELVSILLTIPNSYPYS